LRYLICFLLLLLSSCARQAEDPTIAQMRVRKMQSRTFVSHGAKEVIREMVAVLQDEGYIVKNISHDVGVLTAECDTQIEKFSSKFWAYLLSGKRARWKKHSLVEMTSNISEEAGGTKLRVNFHVRVFNNLGHVVDVHQVLDEKPYVDFFNKVQKGLLSH